MKNLILAIVMITLVSTVLARPASAFEIAPMVGARFDTFSTDIPNTTYSSTFGYQYGGLLFVTMIPFLIDLRTGVLFKSRSVGGTASGFSYTIKDQTLDVPINLQVGLPLSLYVFGGIIYSSTQSTTCTASSGGSCLGNSGKTNDDVPIDLGVGYNLINDGLFKLGIEAEYDLGTRNLNNNQVYGDVYFRGYTFNALARFGF